MSAVPATLPPAPPPPGSYPTTYPAAPLSTPGSASNVPAVLGTATQPTRGMYTAAAVINWVYLGIIIVATLGIGIICAAWFVPMTIQMHKGAKGPYKHTSLGVCTLLFCNVISGILLLVDDSGKQPKPRY